MAKARIFSVIVPGTGRNLKAGSGVQQRYDAKVKAKRKAAMDAKKNALRAEDILNGVFIPVNQSPKQEPKVVKRGDTALPTAMNQ